MVSNFTFTSANLRHSLSFLLMGTFLFCFTAVNGQHTRSKDTAKKEAALKYIQPFFQQMQQGIKQKLREKEYPAACWAPDTDLSVIERMQKLYPHLENSLGTYGSDGAKRVVDRWTTTATNGAVPNQGDTMTLTWSYVPDGTAIASNCFGASGDTSNFVAFFNGIFGSPTTPGDLTTAPWHTIFVNMFDDWASKSGLTFVYEDNDDGADYATHLNPGVLGVRGDIRIGGDTIDGNSGILACNYYPNTGDMIIDTGDNFYSNNPGVGTSNVLAHETGHGLGFAHVCPTNQTKLMEPFISLAFNGPQEDDILAVNRNYGDFVEDNDVFGNATDLGALALGVPVTEICRSIDDDSDIDYYQITPAWPSELTITLTPTGTTYLEGPQVGGSCTPGTPFNALTVADLKVELLAADGTTVLATSDVNGAGGVETINFEITSGGNRYVRVTQSTAVDDAQMYSLEVSAAVICPLVTEVFINEFHYDNAGADVGEFVEVAVANSFSGNLSDITFTLYNGSNGAMYGTPYTLDQFTMGSDDGTFTYYTRAIPNIQNGSPDGFALSCDSIAFQFLSYEGSFTATNGPANGQTSTDVGVSEPSNAPVGSAIQLIGGVWIYTPGFNTAGGPNMLAACSISNVAELGSASCGANVTFEVTFDVQNGGGTYNVVNTGTNQILGSDTGPTTGTDTIQGVLAIPIAGGTIDVTVVDANDPACVGDTIQISYPTCPAVCTITSITVANISACINGGNDMDPSNDTYTANVTVNYVAPETTGTLDLSGDGNASVNANAIGATAHTFIGVVMPADGGPISLTAAFSNNASCTLTNNNAGTAPNSCSSPCNLPDVPTLSVSPDTLCPGGNTATITISGNLNDATEWTVYSGSCGGTVVGTTSTSSFDVSPSVTTTYYVAGTGGCVSSPVCASITVIVEDNTNPSITCPSDVNQSNDAGFCYAVVTGIDASASDNCGTTNITYNFSGATAGGGAGSASGSTFNVGVTSVTYDVNDGNGNTNSCSFNVTITDDEDPNAVCMDTTVYLDNMGNVTVVPSDVDGGSTDNCSISISSVTPNTFDCMTITGGAIPADDMVITAVYDGPLSGGLPKGVELYVLADIPDLSIFGISSANNGNGPTGAPEFTFPAVSATAGDFIYIASEANGFQSWFGFAPDYTDGAMSINGDDAIELFKNGVVIDVFGDVNTDGTGEPWEYQDGWAYRKDVTGPDGSTFVLANWNFSGPNALDGETSNATAANPVPVGTYQFPMGNGMAMVTLTVADPSGNMDQCTATVTVRDTTPPEAICKATYAVDLDANGTAVIAGIELDNGSTDNCSIVTYAASPNIFDCTNVGVNNTVILTVTDIESNTDTCSTIVTVNDTVPPSAVCKTAIVSLDANGMGSIVAADVDGGSTDNCSLASISVSQTDFDCTSITPLVPADELVITGVIDGPLSGGLPKGVELYVLADIPDLSIFGISSANNGNGPTGAPEFTFPAISVSAGDFIYLASETNGFNTFFGFDPDFVTNAMSINGDDAIELFKNGVVIDVFGDVNTDGSGEPWEYRDGWAYRASASGPDGSTFVLSNWGFSGPDALDGESSNATAATPFPIGSYTYPIAAGTVTVELYVEDDQGLRDTCQATVLVLDNIPPSAVCIDGSVTLDNNGEAIIDGSTLDGGSTDNCSVTDFTTDPDSVTCDDVGTKSVVVIVSDQSGNRDSCTANVDVIASLACPPPAIDNQGGPTIADPCTCRGNGEFDEEVVIGPANPGQEWTVSTTSLINPATGQPYAPGTLFNEVVINGETYYTLVGIHLDGVGYDLTATSRFFPGQPLSISNVCFYPDPVIADFQGPFCLFTPPVTFSGSEFSGAQGTGQFFINGNPVTTNEVPAGSGNFEAEVDVAALGLGTYTLRFEFDAGDPAAQLLPPDIGCVDFAEEIFRVVQTPSNIACNDNIQVSLNENCVAEITPDMVLEGTYLCFDDYKVELFRGNRAIATSPNLTSLNIGQNITAKVTHLVSGNYCWGNITVEDKLAPAFTCPTAPIQLTCLDDAAAVPPPVVVDNCDPAPTINLVSETNSTDDKCEVNIITRIWIATDRYGNHSEPCTQIIEVSPNVAIEFPEDITWTCEQYAAYNTIINPEPLHTCLQDPSLDAEDDVPGVDAFDSWSDAEDFDVPLDPLYDDNIDNPITDPIPNILDDPGTAIPNDPIYNTLGTVSPETDTYNGIINPLVCNLSVGLSPVFFEYVNPAPHIPDTIKVPNYRPINSAGLPVRGLEDADVLELTGSGIPNVQNGDCAYAVTYKDTKLVACDGVDTNTVFKILRTWTVFNWCTGQAISEIQVIKVIDRKAPEITFTDDFDDVLSANVSGQGSHGDCGSSGLLDVPTIKDNCSGIKEVRVFTPVGEGIPVFNGGVLVGFNIPAPYLPSGFHTVTYQAVDSCGNTATQDVRIRVEDDYPPVAVCREFTKVALSSTNEIAVSAVSFDEGSYDNCGPVFFKVRRMEDYCAGFRSDQTSFNDEIHFCCEDVGDTINVILRVYDRDPGTGSTSQSRFQDNANECMIQVYVEDKVRPVCTAPEDVWTNCTEIPANVDLSDTTELQNLFGDATAIDNCSAEMMELPPNVEVDFCGVGRVTRRFRAIDRSGNISIGNCSQTIMIMQVTSYELEIPGDFEDECTDISPDTLNYIENGCDLLAINVEDREFLSNPDGACKKILRTYSIINWCEYDGFSNPVVIPRLDLNRDGIVGDGFTPSNTRSRYRSNYRLISNGDYLYLNVINDPVTRLLPSTGYYTYEQHIKIFDDTAPVLTDTLSGPFCGGELDEDPCTGLVDLLPAIEELCTPDDITITWQLDVFNDGTFDLTGSDALQGRFPLGSHRARFRVADDCGNISQIDIPFEIIDCKAPTPVCYNGLAIDLMVGGMVEVWASDFNASSFDYCHPIKLRINRVDDVNGDGVVNSNDYRSTPPTTDSIILRCSDLGTQIVQFWVGEVSGDGVNTWDFCATFIDVQDNNNVCGSAPKPFVMGEIKTEATEPVQHVKVDLSGHTNKSMTTLNDGAYEFENLDRGYDYSVAPLRDDDLLNGVSTFDLVLINKHILHTELLDSPYRIIAADANNSGTVTTLDIVILRKLILRTADELPNNTSWRFVAANHQFADPLNPWTGGIPEILSYNNLDQDIANADFIAIKIGDVSGNAQANDFTSVDNRTYGTLEFNAPDIDIQTGEIYEIPVSIADKTIEGYQFTLKFDTKALEFIAIDEGVATAQNFGTTNIAEGIITASWNGKQTASEQFTLVLKAKTQGALHDFIEMNSAVTPGEAYTGNQQLLRTRLTFGQSFANAYRFRLYPNIPNPFNSSTTIGFELPEATSATITITDITGKVVKVIEGDYVKGYNSIEVNRSELNASGVLSYKLETNDNTAVRKMILID